MPYCLLSSRAPGPTYDDVLLADGSYLQPNDGLHANPAPAVYLHEQYTRSWPEPGEDGYVDAESADRLPDYSVIYGAGGAEAEAAVQAGEHGKRNGESRSR